MSISSSTTKKTIMVSTFQRATAVTKPRDMDVETVLNVIRTGGKKLKGQIQQIRNKFEFEVTLHGDYKKAKESVSELKKALPGVTWSGTFSYRDKDGIKKHSGLLCIDLDNLNATELPVVRGNLVKSPSVWALFTSPTNTGLKIIFLVPPDDAKHLGSFLAAEQHVREITGKQIDQSGKDVARFCFFSYDPELHHNPDAIPIEPLPEPPKPQRVLEQPTGRNGKPDKAQIREMLTFAPKRPDYADWIKVVAAVGDALPDDEAIEVLTEWSPEEQTGEYAEKLRHRLEDVHVGTLIHLAREHGYVTSLPDQAVKQQIEPATTLRIAKLTPPDRPVSFEQWRDVIEAKFPTLVRPAETCLCVVVQLLLNDLSNPFALVLVDVPSSGKTITLNFFDVVTELTYTTDNFTPASFVSHASNVKREDLGKVDLLPRIRYRTLIVRELGSIFGAKDDDLIKSLGILTRVLDGEGLETDSGVHGRRGYKGDYLFMFLAGTTPIPPRVFKIMGNFGSRLFFLSLRSLEEDDDDLIAQNRGTDRKEKEIACQRATERFLRALWAANPNGVTWNKAGDSDDCLRVIARCARLLATLRGAINIWPSDHSAEGNKKLLHNVPVIEKPHRINCLLYNLARAHALVCGRRRLTPGDMWPVLDITFDSAPTIRAKVFRGLIEAGGTLNTSSVVKLLGCSSPTARKEMEALCVLGIADKTADGDDELGRPETQIKLASKFAWFESDECKSLMTKVAHTQGGNLFKIQVPTGIKKEFPPCVTVKDAVSGELEVIPTGILEL